MSDSVSPIQTSPSNPPQTPTQENTQGTPPISTSSSPTTLSNRRAHSPLSIDLQNIPPLSTPTPPSNTLLITRLEDPHIFHPASLATIREHLTSIAPLHSFAPLKSLSRIIVSFYDAEGAVKVRQQIDGAAILGNTVAKCYFGEPTPIDDTTKYLAKPDAGRLFFISPPPSPPVGWEMRPEDPPNKEVHADDLAAKLERLTGRMQHVTANGEEEDGRQTYTAEELHRLKMGHARLVSIDEGSGQSPVKSSPGVRSRSSTLIYDPVLHGDSPTLPAVMLETEDEEEEEEDARDYEDVEMSGVSGKKILTHTARPPLELMNGS